MDKNLILLVEKIVDDCVLLEMDECGLRMLVSFWKLMVESGGSRWCLKVHRTYLDVRRTLLTEEKFSMKDMGEADVILGIRIIHEMSTPMVTSEKLMPNNGQAVSQVEYSRVISCLMYVMTCTRPDIAFEVGKKDTLVQAGSAILKTIRLPVGRGVRGCRRSLLVEFLVRYFIASRGVTTSSTIEYEFLALAAAGKKAEWLSNLILKIILWSKHIAPISVCFDNAATLAKAYSQMYNEKSRNLDVRHSIIRKLIMNEVESKEFVRSHQNLADHLTKRLVRDLVIKSTEGIDWGGGHPYRVDPPSLFAPYMKISRNGSSCMEYTSEADESGIDSFEGMVKRHNHLRIGKYHQHLAEKLNLDMSALLYMMREYPGNEEEKMWASIGRFGLTGKAQTMPMKNLSYSQKSRVIFAWLAFRQPQMLLLDEPTNHLDIETIDSLAEALNEWDGGMVLVSHDFRLINQVALDL
uniref:ABC transporter F family member 1-like n=1 Tax=Tanacetum cinerariifolium TaxID=118510 RepID=A0A6L2KF46_TANCI|nr:ABC transporter F family member 1-like [Tanacetum cinerariifolium]